MRSCFFEFFWGNHERSTHPATVLELNPHLSLRKVWRVEATHFFLGHYISFGYSQERPRKCRARLNARKYQEDYDDKVTYGHFSLFSSLSSSLLARGPSCMHVWLILSSRSCLYCVVISSSSPTVKDYIVGSWGEDWWPEQLSSFFLVLCMPFFLLAQCSQIKQITGLSAIYSVDCFWHSRNLCLVN